MTPTQLKEAAQVMLAAAEGKALQSCDIGKNNWVNVNWIPRWDWSSTEYRIKPEPREFWANPDMMYQCSREPQGVHGNWIKVREVLE